MARGRTEVVRYLGPAPGGFAGNRALAVKQGRSGFGINVEAEGAIAALDDLRIDVRKALGPTYKDIAQRVERIARPNIPIATGKLRGDIRTASTEIAATVRVGRAKVPYAGPAHWGWQQPGPHSRKLGQKWKTTKPGRKFIWLVVYPNDNSDDGPADWIQDLIYKAMNEAIAKFDRTQRKALKQL